MIRHFYVCLFTACLSACFVPPAAGAEYFVSRDGSDGNDGLGRETAFATVQRGVDALAPGDTLTILPGEYFGAVRRSGIGSPEKNTLIRAEIPGTAILRGDLPVADFRKKAGYRFVYEADFAFDGRVVTVNERDTLKVFEAAANIAELDFLPGVFYHDRAAEKLYLSASDLLAANNHRYSATVVNTHGLYLSAPRRVTLEGLAVTGFNATEVLNYREKSMGAVWGIFLAGAADCVVRDCRAWLNGRGIGLNSEAAGSGGNLIERCAAWANVSQFDSGDTGGLTILSGRRDTIRDSVSFLNGSYGVNIYGTGTDGGAYADPNVPGNDEANKSRLTGNLAWGNWCDFKIKTGVDYFHTVESCVGPGLWSVRPTNIFRSIIGWRGEGYRPDSINLPTYDDLVPAAEFADPDNHDYRLQAASRFRGAGPGGADRGPFDYEKNIFYLDSAGDDSADGLSASSAWKTLARAAVILRPGDTLYLAPGIYRGNLDLSPAGKEGKPVSIRGRGRGPAVIRGGLRLNDCRSVEFRRVGFDGAVTISRGADIVFEDCRFEAPGAAALSAEKTTGLAVGHCAFADFGEAAVTLRASSGARLAGNLFENRLAPALRADTPAALAWSDYNGYLDPAHAWELQGQAVSLEKTPAGHERHSIALPKTGRRAVSAPAAGGPLDRPLGPGTADAARPADLRLAVPPQVHAVGATTVDIEWMATRPGIYELAWGETPACENRDTLEVNYFGSYSLTGLAPGRTYYFRIDSVRALETSSPTAFAEEAVRSAGEPLAFTTLAANPPPAVYHVAPDGDDGSSGLDRNLAWRTLTHAAGRVRAGDTVLVAGGTYRERVRVRATGAPDAPVVFRAAPGDKVVLDGMNNGLTNAFIVTAKSFLRFDGFYLKGFNLFPSQGWMPQQAAEFLLYRGRDIQVTRCFSDGRGGYSARSVVARQVADLLVKNCVNTNKMSGAVGTSQCPGLRVENCVFARPMIGAMSISYMGGATATIRGNIFTDMLEKKAVQNISLFEVEDGTRLIHENNCYQIRVLTPEKRNLLSFVDHSVHRVTRTLTIPDLERESAGPRSLFADPGFAGVPAGTGGFPPDYLMNSALELDFSDFFAANPEVAGRGIGLEREAFAEFHFNR